MAPVVAPDVRSPKDLQRTRRLVDRLQDRPATGDIARRGQVVVVEHFRCTGQPERLKSASVHALAQDVPATQSERIW